MTRSLLSRRQTNKTTSSEGVLCDKYGVKTLENEGVCLYGRMSATWAVKQKTQSHILITMADYLA
jgi:hypothetical protein